MSSSRSLRPWGDRRRAGPGRGDLELHYTATFRTHPSPQAAGTVYFPLDVDDVPAAGGSWPDRLTEVRPKERVLRRPVSVPTLDVPMPQMVDQLVDILKIMAKLSPAVEEQVIDVPKIIQDPTPQRLELSEPQQLVEQLVEVPVVLTLAFVGACFTAMGRFTGGCRAPATSRGAPRRGSPPAQGGLQKLSSGATVDVPVNMHDKFQQSLPVDSEVPQFHFSRRVVDSPVMPQRQVRPVLTVQKTGDSTGAVLLELLTRPLTSQ